MFVKKNLIV